MEIKPKITLKAQANGMAFRKSDTALQEYANTFIAEIVKNGELYLFGASIVPLISASTHVVAEDRRTRKLLLHRAEIDKLVGAVERKGYTLVPLALYWKSNHVKIDLGVARGKQEHDKRDVEKERDWNREKQRVMRAKNRTA